jgi:CRP-like cAMP-binding protein
MAASRPVSVRKGHIIIAEGAEADDVYLINSGRFQISLMSAHGREVILRDMGADRIVGELAAIDRLPRSASVIALEDAQLAHMRGDEFVAFLGSVPQAGLWMAQQLAARVRDLTEKTFELATLSVSSRIHAELMRLAATAKDQGDKVTVTGFPTHAEMAARVGTHREAVSRELSQLAQEGLIKRSGRTLDILSVSGLHALSARLRR